MNLTDVERAMELKDSVGWNQVEWDWKTFLNLNPELCYVATVGDEVVGTTTAISFAGKVAWIGMVIVDEGHRGKGIGKLLMNRAIHDLDDHDTIKLDATAMGLPVYEKLGFRAERTFYRMICKDGNLQQIHGGETLTAGPCFELLAAWDRKVLGYDRSLLLRSLVDKYGSLSGVVLSGEEVSGYLLGRAGSNFTQLGPLVASTVDNARRVTEGVLSSGLQGAIVVDVNSDKTGFIEWLRQLGFSKQREFVRMYLGDETSVKEELQYLIAGPEFG